MGHLKSSLSARRAWIEITRDADWVRVYVVALRKESVDRNQCYAGVVHHNKPRSLSARRAWIEIRKKPLRIKLLTLSLSARRAWIEMSPLMWPWSPLNKSLSARRAWIEIVVFSTSGSVAVVALRKESVDRNCLARIGRA